MPSVVGDKQRQVGNKGKITRAEHPEPSGRQVGVKRRQVGGKGKFMRAEHPNSLVGDNGDKWETKVESCGQSIQSSKRQVGDKRRQVGDKCKIKRAKDPERTSCKKTSPETNVKSCGRRTHPFQRSKNSSQVNLFGEKALPESE